MPSIKQVAANKANAQRSTGPKTPEGKAASSQNSRTHDLCSKDRLVANENQEEFDHLHAELELDVGPQGEIEQIIFSELVTAAWQLRRIGRMETELSAGHETYTALLDDENLQKKLDRIGRHHTRFERTFHRCLKELKALKTNRARKEEALHQDLAHPGLAVSASEKSEISKRSQPDTGPYRDEPLTEEEYERVRRIMADKYGFAVGSFGGKAA